MTDESKEKQQEKQEQLALQAELSDLRKVLATPEGKRVAFKILEFCGVYRNPYAGDAAQTNFNCGMQSVGQWFLDEALSAHPVAVSEIFINNKVKDNDNRK